MEDREVDAQLILQSSSMEGIEGSDLIAALQTQLKSMSLRVQELEAENAVMASQISRCCCGKVRLFLVANYGNGDSDNAGLPLIGGSEEERLDSGKRREGNGWFGEVGKARACKMSPGCERKNSKPMLTRYIALKIMYFGQRFYGFASQAQMDPTVESEIFKALKKTRLLVSSEKEAMYSRCGRTDRGVSSVGQVISLFLRSKLKDSEMLADNREISPNDTLEEIDYVKVLNRVLPNDIRVISCSPAPVDFHARFSCLSREYKYLFWKGNLDTTAMERAGKKFVGQHDFRNFCKMDAANVHNYSRHITCFDIFSCKERCKDDQLWAIRIKGSAFLWHQVRCMVAVLFMIGQGLESPSIIEELLDTERTPRKPQYKMAPELPLILQSCEFKGLNFTCSPDAQKVLHEHFETELKSHKLQAAIFEEALLSCLSTINDGSPLIKEVKKATHVPLLLRPTEPSYEERQAKLKLRAQE
ncbi:hypothetical protein Syun_013716 [Stephania yunnanensis]|uniref:Pseudouridine synthase I TruA alpha/beta domain-containing protein n=1 Tax=Stephania yunnanensis TaxID=152371 RepID=A0AAP0JJ12_9MAGN